MRALLLLPLLLASCTVSNAKWNVALGGKGAYAGRDFSVTWDNVKSFRDAAVLATAAVGAWANVASDKAAEATTRTVDSNRSAEAINASNNATSVQLGEQAAGIEHAKLAKP
jgi:hypothetical protein